MAAARQKKINDLELQLSCLTEDIKDHVNESSIQSFIVVEDIDSAVCRAETLRTEFRGQLQQLREIVDENYGTECGTVHTDELNGIKSYITTAKQLKQKLRREDATQKSEKEKYELSMNSKATTFLCTEFNRSVSELTATFK